MKKKNKHDFYKCYCCGYYTLSSGDMSSYEICNVCFWEDDEYQYDNPDSAGGANKVSLNQARLNYKAFGVSKKEFLQYVSKPDIYNLED